MATRAAGTAKSIMSMIWSPFTPKRMPQRLHRHTARMRPEAMIMPYQ